MTSCRLPFHASSIENFINWFNQMTILCIDKSNDLIKFQRLAQDNHFSIKKVLKCFLETLVPFNWIPMRIIKHNFSLRNPIKPLATWTWSTNFLSAFFHSETFFSFPNRCECLFQMRQHQKWNSFRHRVHGKSFMKLRSKLERKTKFKLLLGFTWKLWFKHN